MSTCTRVVGIGQKVAGDDGVGIAVLEELARRPLPEGTEIVRLADPMELLPLLEAEEPLVLVDAVLGSPAGVVVELSPEQLSSKASQPTSSHGMGAAQAIELAKALSPARNGTVVRVVAITIARPDRYRVGLSPEVLAAVPSAADRVLQLLGA